MTKSSQPPDSAPALLESRLAHFIAAPPPANESGVGSEDEFNTLALTLFAWQFARNTPYANYCRAVGVPDPAGLTSWTQIPAAPADAFKNPDLPLTCFPAEQATACFETSGTTSDRGERGRHFFQSTSLYRQSIVRGWQSLGLPSDLPPVFLIPPPSQAPESSLSFMMGTLADTLPSTGSGNSPFLVDAGGNLDLAALIKRCDAGEPLILFGTALSFLHLFDRLAPDTRLPLPPRSWAMETGGYKGTSRTLTKHELYALFENRLSLDPDRVINEYSMTELSSQFYTTGLDRPHRGPHWTRTRVIDPATGAETADGEPGLLHIFDLANLHSCLAIATQDLAIRQGAGEQAFNLIGRNPAALPRGCSRAADELLS